MFTQTESVVGGAVRPNWRVSSRQTLASTRLARTFAALTTLALATLTAPNAQSQIAPPAREPLAEPHALAARDLLDRYVREATRDKFSIPRPIWFSCGRLLVIA